MLVSKKTIRVIQFPRCLLSLVREQLTHIKTLSALTPSGVCFDAPLYHALKRSLIILTANLHRHLRMFLYASTVGFVIGILIKAPKLSRGHDKGGNPIHVHS
jgi:hypothetical protein